MKDRIALYPGRVKLTPVSGQENTYDMVRADEPTQAGTPLNKENLLKDTTAALFGLDEAATPDIVLQWLGKYNEHWWSLYYDQSSQGYKESLTTLTSSVGPFYPWNAADENRNTIYYSKELEINQSDGSVSLKNPTEHAMYAYEDQDTFFNSLISMAPVYITGVCDTSGYGPTDEVYQIPVGAVLGTKSSASTIWKSQSYESKGWRYEYRLVPYNSSWNTTDASIAPSLVSSEFWALSAGETTYEHSTDRNAYPDSGTVDGITYSYLGVPFEKFPTMPQIEMGSYTGTGTYGSSNPNSLTFSFSPKILYLLSDVDQYLLFTFLIATATHAASRIYNGSAYTLYVTWSENAVSWYGKTSGSEQFNASGNTYYYVAIG